MDCFTDQICFLGSAYETLIQAAGLVDFFGASVMGDDWQALTPLVQHKFETLFEFAAKLTPVEYGTCGATPATVTSHA